MPRLPVDGKKVIEHRITLGGVEREALKSIATSARITSFAGDDGVLNEFNSIKDLTKKLAIIGLFLELLGITDVFNFDDEGRAEAFEIISKVDDRIKEKGVVSAAGKLTIDSLIEILSLGKFESDVFG
jgi:hypothetical protein